MNRLGIDVGGSGIKAAVVDTDEGRLVSERLRLPTPSPSTPENVVAVIAELVDELDCPGAIGCCLPTVVIDGVAKTAGNIDPAWRGAEILALLRDGIGRPFALANDADAAGLAEMRYGAGRELAGRVITITIGTGLGSGVFVDGRLIPNVELGRMPGKNGEPIEFYAGNRARKEAGLSWEDWGERFNRFLERTARVFAPDHFILGGGASRKYDRYRDAIRVRVPVHIAEFRNDAGIVGAAMLAAENLPDR